jgi:hypothetical protein
MEKEKVDGKMALFSISLGASRGTRRKISLKERMPHFVRDCIPSCLKLKNNYLNN